MAKRKTTRRSHFVNVPPEMRVYNEGWQAAQGRYRPVRNPKGRNLVDAFVQKFPGRCPICSFHRYGIEMGAVKWGQPVEPHEGCVERQFVARRFQRTPTTLKKNPWENIRIVFDSRKERDIFLKMLGKALWSKSEGDYDPRDVRSGDAMPEADYAEARWSDDEGHWVEVDVPYSPTVIRRMLEGSSGRMVSPGTRY